MTAARTAGGDAVDLRLSVGAAAAWIAVLALPNGSLVTAAVSLAVGVAALAARMLWRGMPTLALAAFAIALVQIPSVGRTARSSSGELHHLAVTRAAVSLELRIAGDAHALASRSVAGPARVAIDARAVGVVFGTRVEQLAGTLLVLAPARSWSALLPGEVVRADGRLAPSLAGDTTVLFSVQRAPVSVRGPPWWQRAAAGVRSSLRRAMARLPDGPRGLLPGLVDGDTSQLDPVLKEHFRIAGLTHLVAVSGMNLSILLGVVLLAARRAGARPWACASLGAIVVVAFVVVARPEPSVLRAAVMGIVTLAALAIGRPRQAVPALAAAVLVLLSWNPGLAVDPAFAMSVSASAALVLLAPTWAKALRSRGVPAGVAESLAVAAAAHLVTAPIVVAISGRLSLVAIPANVLAEPAVVLTTILGFATALFAPVYLPAAQLLAELASWPCRWLIWVADEFGDADGAALPWPAGVRGGLLLAAVVAVGAVLVRFAFARRVLLAAALVAGLVQGPVRWAVTGWPRPGWLFTACDVGQGDGLVVPVAPNSAVVVDTGPEPLAIDRCLHDLGIDDVPLLVLTHMHLDHVGGVGGVLRGRRVHQVITGPLLQPQSGLDIVQSFLGRRGLHMQFAQEGSTFRIGAVRFEVLGPHAPFHATHSDPNNSSVAIRMTVGGTRVMLAADMEREAQRAMLDEHIDVSADVLKVPHHGSAYSDRDFLAAIGARVGVISVGRHNDYGQPAPVLLRALVGLGIAARRTDLDGDVAFVRTSRGVRAVVRGKVGSTLGLGTRRAQVRPRDLLSAAGVRMGGCQPDRSPQTSCLTCCRGSCSSSATKSCWLPGRSPRSPPPPGAATPD